MRDPFAFQGNLSLITVRDYTYEVPVDPLRRLSEGLPFLKALQQDN